MDVIDLHCHLLPGIDDGPASIEESIALARAAVADGTNTIVATPHVSWHYPNDAETIARLAGQLKSALAAQGIDLEVRCGAEIAMTKVGEIDHAQLSELGLGGGRWLLIEPPFAAAAPAFEAVVLDLMREGHGVVIAHPERCHALHRRPETLAGLVSAGALTSITASSLTGRFGGPARRFAQRLVEENMVHNVASDAHDTIGRPPDLASEIARAGLTDLREWLTEAVPRAIFFDDPIPPPPAPTRRFGRRPSARLLRRLRAR